MRQGPELGHRCRIQNYSVLVSLINLHLGSNRITFYVPAQPLCTTNGDFSTFRSNADSNIFPLQIYEAVTKISVSGQIRNYYFFIISSKMENNWNVRNDMQ